jgi:AcrR family transcriptional regulator
VTTERPARGTRPRNRRAQILDAAADLFVRVGYPRVSMGDIAEAVAITPSALYRHFRGKEELLHEAVRMPFAAVSAALEGASTGQLHDLVGALAEGVMDHRGLGVLWQRESRHLPPSRRDELRAQLVGAEKVFSARLRVERPDLSGPQSDLLAWAALAGLMSVAFQGVELPRPEYVALLTGIGHDIASTPVDTFATDEPLVDTREPAPRDGGHPATTADRLVATAARLFAERGFRTVGIDEVGAEVGIAGPSVYHHFAGKVELLAAAMGDGARQLLDEQARITDSAAPPEQMLTQLMRSYIDFSFEHRYVVDLMITETASLTPAQTRRALGQQRTYVAGWVRLLGLAHPELPRGHARVRVQAVHTITNDISRTAHLNSQPGVREAVAAVGLAVLGLGQATVTDRAVAAGRVPRGTASPGA